MENLVKTVVEGIDPQTGENHKMAFEGNAVCVVTINDADGGVTSEECLMGNVNLDRAMAMVKGLTSACNHLLSELPRGMAHFIMAEMLSEVMGKIDDDEQEAVKSYDERRFAQ